MLINRETETCETAEDFWTIPVLVCSMFVILVLLLFTTSTTAQWHLKSQVRFIFIFQLYHSDQGYSKLRLTTFCLQEPSGQSAGGIKVFLCAHFIVDKCNSDLKIIHLSLKTDQPPDVTCFTRCIILSYLSVSCWIVVLWMFDLLLPLAAPLWQCFTFSTSSFTIFTLDFCLFKYFRPLSCMRCFLQIQTRPVFEGGFKWEIRTDWNRKKNPSGKEEHVLFFWYKWFLISY